jgi:DNA end-binding protein Ku
VPSIWKGSIAFGLVNVPVELRQAVRDHRLSFRMLHGKAQTPIRYKRVREDTGDEVAWGDIVKGYEYEKGEYVVLTEKDFREAAIEQTNTLDIRDFVDAGEIDPRFYESAYYIVPGKGGDRAYALLRDAMIETGMTGVGTIIIRKRQHIAGIRPHKQALLLMMMRFADELVAESEYEFPSAARGDTRELKMASELVRSLKASFDPDKYKDEYDANLRRIIRARSKGKRVSLTGPSKEEREPKVIDLMERLQASLRETKRKTPARARKRKSA